MTMFLLPAALLSLRALRPGHVRLSAFGVCATVGVVLAMMVAGRSARRAGISSEAAWDTGLFAVICCFAASRLLLILRDPAAFAHYPLLVLALPSLTFGGLLLAAVLVGIYLRRKRFPVLTMLDVFAAAGAVLATALELGHWLDGSEPGMPAGYLRNGQPWNVQNLHLYPTALLGMLAALVVAAVLTGLQQRLRSRPGRLAAVGLGLGGVAALVLGMVSLPDDVVSTSWLEPGQMVALGACLAGAILWTAAPNAGAQNELPVVSTTDATPGESLSFPLPSENR